MQPGESQIEPKFLKALSNRANSDGLIPYDVYIEMALYHSDLGYYQQSRERVGRNFDQDFYTAVDLGPVFKNCLIEALEELTPGNPEDYSLVEIAAEPGKGTFSETDNPFRDYQIIHLNEALEIPEKAVVFSNEWLDAQPFKRFQFCEGKWWECGIRIDAGKLTETLMEGDVPQQLPPDHAEGYRFDWPSGAHQALMELLKKDWSGAFLTFDYGTSLQTALHEKPNGTARTYYRHNIDNDLLDKPGEKDITLHLIWDQLEKILLNHRFKSVQLMRQETFLMKYAEQTIASILTKNPGQFSPERQVLKELLHPNNMGSKFQALSGIREN